MRALIEQFGSEPADWLARFMDGERSSDGDQIQV